MSEAAAQEPGNRAGPGRMPEPVAQVAAFDFDGTLTHGGSVWQFLVAVIGTRRVAMAAVALATRLARAAAFGGHYADEAKEALFRRTLRGLSFESLAPVAADFGRSHFVRRARSDVRERLEWHRSQGHHVVIVSASPELYVRAAAAEIGVSEVVATRLEVDAYGRLTGSYEGQNCRGAQKLARLEEWMRTSGLTAHVGEGLDAARTEGVRTQKPYLWAYGNSAGDLPLLEAADVGIDAGRLGRLGKLRRYRRLADL